MLAEFGLVPNLRVRDKFLLSLILITSVLMGATLLIVGHSVRSQVQREIQEESHNAILTFRVLQRERQIALGRRAELFANLALMRNDDPTAVQAASEDPWQSQEDDLLLLADARGKIVALHSTASDLPRAEIQSLLRQSLKAHATSDWWSIDGQLYQVVLRPVSPGAGSKSAALGNVVVGTAVNVDTVNDLRRITSTEVAFLYGGKIIASTFLPLEELALQQQVGGKPAPSEVRIDGKRFLALTAELNPGDPSGTQLVILKSYDDAIRAFGPLNRTLIALLLIALAGGAALVFLLSRRFTRPLASLAEGVRALEQGDFNYPLEPARGRDEVAHVTRAFEEMRQTLQRNETERQQLEGQLRQVSRMEAMGRLAGGVAHDFNNLLTVIKGHSQLLLDRISGSEPLHSSSQQIANAAERAAGLTRQLLAFSRKQVLVPRVLDLNALISEISKLLSRLIRENVEFVFQPGEYLWRLRGDPGQIEQVIMNLAVNASDAMPSGGKLVFETYNVDANEDMVRARPGLRPGRYVALAVTDTGCGMDAATQAHIFEPFFTTKSEGKGTGLGLATVYGIVKQSNGYIWVESAPGRGSRFEVYLPQSMEPAEVVRWEQAATPHPGHGKRVLIVEDDLAVRELASDFLAAAGYKVSAVGSAEEAIEIAKSTSERFHVLVTDVILPHMRGTELAEHLRSILPDLRIVFTSGYVEHEKVTPEFIEAGTFLQKPYTREALLSSVDQVLVAKVRSSRAGSRLRSVLKRDSPSTN